MEIPLRRVGNYKGGNGMFMEMRVDGIFGGLIKIFIV